MRGRSEARLADPEARIAADIAEPSAIPTVRMTPLMPVAMPTSPAATVADDQVGHGGQREGLSRAEHAAGQQKAERTAVEGRDGGHRRPR